MSYLVQFAEHSSAIDESLRDLYYKVMRELSQIDLKARGQEPFSQWLQPFDPAPWKTQLNSLAALVTSIRLALLTRLLFRTRDAGFRPTIQHWPLQGFFESRVNKRNAP